MITQRATKLITWMLSIILPVGFLVLFLVSNLYMDRYSLDAEWLWWIPIDMVLIFTGVWGLYFFLSWSLAKKNFDGSELSNKQVVFRKRILVAVILTGILSPVILYMIIWWVIYPVIVLFEQ